MTDITTPAQMREAAALLPCPFCGSNNAIVLTVKRGDEHRMYPLVRCIGCYLDMPGQNGDYSTDGRTAIAAWNRRALPVSEPEPVAVNAVMCAAERDAQSRDAVDLTLFRQAIRAEALEEAAALPPYDCDGDPAGPFDHHVFVKRDAIRALMEKPTC